MGARSAGKLAPGGMGVNPKPVAASILLVKNAADVLKVFFPLETPVSAGNSGTTLTPRPHMKTAKLALIFAALVLLVLAITNYTELMEKRFARQFQMQESIAGAGLVAQSPGPGGAQKPASPGSRLDERVAPQVPARDEEVDRLREELDALEQESAVMNKKFDEIARQERIDALGGTPPLNPEASLTPQQQRIKRAVPVGAVTAFDKDWGFVSINAGAERGLTIGKQLAVRRGTDVVGMLEVTSVESESSIADVLGQLGTGPGERPQAGDAVILWPLF